MYEWLSEFCDDRINDHLAKNIGVVPETPIIIIFLFELFKTKYVTCNY